MLFCGLNNITALKLYFATQMLDIEGECGEQSWVSQT